MVAQAAQSADFESFLAFWAEAGVDYALEDEPQDRMKARATPRPPAPPAPAAAIAEPAATAPQDLLAQRAAAVASAAATLEDLDEARTRFLLSLEPRNRSPAGQARSWRAGSPLAPVAIVADLLEADAEAEDRDQVLEGVQARLLRALLAGAGIEDQFMSCALAPAPGGGGAADPALLAGLAPFVLRLLELSGPRVVLVLGAAAAKALGPALADEDAGASGEGALILGPKRTPVVVTLHPRFLLRQPIGKKRAWADVLALSARLRRAGAAQSP